ncbi:MAG: metallophosphoesterase [Bryobacteraceae bacterium]|nr:metallophosphoesterase [Bryobacteraceae bacterium]
METLRRWAPVAVIILVTLLAHRDVLRRLARLPGMRARPQRLRACRAALIAMSAWMAAVVPVLTLHNFAWLPADVIAWALALSLFWVLAVLCFDAWLAWAQPASFNPSRRRMLAAALPAAAAPLGGAGFGIALARYGMSVVQQDIVIPGLPRDLHGLRIVQLTDIHFGPFFGPAELERAVAMANETRAHIAVLTGDLITRVGDDLEGCIRLLAKLKAEAGVYGCHGNHEKYADLPEQADRLGARAGITFLRHQAALLRFGSARLNLAGLDYFGNGSRLAGRIAGLVEPGAINILLQHNPAHFPAAAETGFDLMLAGHTHGGQVNLPVLRENINIARAFTEFVRGRYQIGDSQLYVSCGLGTVGIPVRLGAPPEVTLVRLCAG